MRNIPFVFLFFAACAGGDSDGGDSTAETDTERIDTALASLDDLAGDWTFNPDGDVCTPHSTCVQWFDLTVSTNGGVEGAAGMQIEGGYFHSIVMEGEVEAVGDAYAVTFTGSNEPDGEPPIPAMACQLVDDQWLCLADTYESSFAFERG